jgi:hypothetical protein
MRAFRMVTVVALAGLFTVTAAAMDLAQTVAGSNDSGEWDGKTARNLYSRIISTMPLDDIKLEFSAKSP